MAESLLKKKLKDAELRKNDVNNKKLEKIQ